MDIYLDVETIPGDTHYIEKIRENIKPPSTMKKAETIEKWMKEKSAEAMAGQVAKLALKPMYCQVICIGVQIGDEQPVAFADSDEFKLLRSFLDYMQSHNIGPQQKYRYCGHNIKKFDLPVLRACCLRNRQFPTPLPKLEDYNKRLFVLDTLEIFQHQYQEFQGLGLDDLSQLLGIGTKTAGMDGSRVYEEYLLGNIWIIAKYCLNDVKLVRELVQLIQAYYI